MRESPDKSVTTEGFGGGSLVWDPGRGRDVSLSSPQDPVYGPPRDVGGRSRSKFLPERVGERFK